MRHFSNDSVKKYIIEYLEKEGQSPAVVNSIEYNATVDGISETCGGCTLGDGQDCSPPRHYVDYFYVVCTDGQGRKQRYFVSMGWSEGGCSNAFGDYNKVELR